MLVTEEYCFDLDSGLLCGGKSDRFLWPVTDVLWLKIHWAEVWLCCVRVG